jgi:glutamyl-Q tRNA(Asp) synthetase
MTYRGRFAPSPTGLLHFGSLVTAVGSWLCARHAGGTWLVRVEDIDPTREVPGSTASILASLDAFGLRAEAEPVYQSRRHAAYESAFARLQAGDHVFPCWCSRSDLSSQDGVHLDGQCVAPANASRSPAWRLRTPDLEVHYRDALQGPQRQNLRDGAGDFVIRRVEGHWAYQLACVVDDADQGVTEVVRGADLLESTPRQMYLQQLLGLPTPRYLHLPLVLDDQGRKLSKSADHRPVDPARALPQLRQALRALGLDRPYSHDSPDSLLAAAARDFHPGLLPRSSHLYG